MRRPGEEDGADTEKIEVPNKHATVSPVNQSNVGMIDLKRIVAWLIEVRAVLHQRAGPEMLCMAR